MITVPDHAEEIKVRLPALLKSQAQIKAVCANTSLSRWVVGLIREAVERKEPKA